VPIANIPYSLEIKGYVAVDISISFLVNNCTPDANENEQTYLVTNEGYIMASNIPDKIGQNIQDAVPGLVRNEIGLHTTRGDLTVIADFETDLMSGAFLKITPNSVIYDNTTQNAIGLLVVYAILLILFLLFNIFSISRYTKPLVSLTACMDQIARDKTWQTDTLVSQEVHYVSEDEIGTLICTFDEMLTTLKDAKIRQYELELENIGATLKMLQAQINPHFIYNMLQYFATSALKNNDMALYSELSSFGQMLHYSMMIDPPVATVNQEIDYIRRYISLQQARFNTTEPADIQVDIEAGLISIPKMSIVPLVENSFKHGKIYRCPGGILQLLVTKKEHNLVIEVTDNGVPIDPQKAEQLCDVLRQFRQRISDHSFSAERPIAEQNVKMGLVDSTSVGLQNVYTRLFLHFGNCSIHMHANQLGGTTVLMSVPLSEKDAEN
jgi:sensor histidine kinase YesM